MLLAAEVRVTVSTLQLVWFQRRLQGASVLAHCSWCGIVVGRRESACTLQLVYVAEGVCFGYGF